jgi:hypothetical protein
VVILAEPARAWRGQRNEHNGHGDAGNCTARLRHCALAAGAELWSCAFRGSYPQNSNAAGPGIETVQLKL